ncbi:Chaperone protein DnaJ [Linum perenne]
MEANIAEAIRAKEIAERRFAERDFVSAKSYALKAKSLCPGLEGVSQMVSTFEVYMASEVRSNGEIDYYSVLGLKPTADRDVVKKQYKKMAKVLHPDKNNTVGADGAFKLVSEAWTMLSDSLKRSPYDRHKQYAPAGVAQTNSSSMHASGVAGYTNCSSSSASHGLDTFWTVCTSCKVQYEYLRKYVNKRLSCKNCRGTFIAVETGTGPATGSFPYSSWSYVHGNGYGSHGYDGVSYVPANATLYTGNGVSGLHTAHGYEYAPNNVSFQWGSYSGTSGVLSPNGATTDTFYQTNGNAGHGRKAKSTSNEKPSPKPAPPNVNTTTSANQFVGCYLTKAGRPDKRRKIVAGAGFRNGYDEKEHKPPSEIVFANAPGAGKADSEPKLPSPVELIPTRSPILPPFDIRKCLIERARSEIRIRLEQMEHMDAARKSSLAAGIPKADSEISGRVSKLHRTGPLSITVPDPDFHDFDKDRSEECFTPKQIWALYDEDDGMPRLYCLIREVVSVKPFKILITYLNSKTDTEFGSMNWISYGFTKSCGRFRAWNSDLVDQVNVFSHLLKGQKAGRGGCVRIFPKCGEIWAVYRNWSPDWDRSTPDEVRHQYEMVEVLVDYSEDQGVCVAPLAKLAGYKTVYQRDASREAIKWIPRPEMFRFSHQVPSWSLDGKNLPDNCWDLDPAATPDELLHIATAAATEEGKV